MKRLIIIGARALGREAYNYAKDAGLPVAGFLDDKFNALEDFSGYPPILTSVENYQIKRDDLFVCAIGDSIRRCEYVNKIETKGGEFTSIIHPTAYIGHNVRIGEGSIICPYSVIDCDLYLGRHVIVNVHSYVPHDSRIEDFVTLSPNVHLGGRTVLRRKVFLGIGVVTIPDIEIGEESFVAAGATVAKSLPEHVLAAGVPARIVRELY